MRKITVIALLVSMVFVFASAAFAGGGKVRGAKGKGFTGSRGPGLVRQYRGR